MVFESTPTFPPRRRFILLDFRRRKWLFGPLVRSTLPVPEMWNRFFAPLWVFSLGIVQLCNTRPSGLLAGAYRRRFAFAVDLGISRNEVPRSDRLCCWFSGFGCRGRRLRTVLALRSESTFRRCGFLDGFDAGPRGEHHAEHTAFHYGFLLKAGVFGDAFGDSAEDIHGDFGVRLFATSESHEDLHFGAVLQEAEDALGLLFDVVIGDLRREADFFEFAGCLRCLSGFLGPFGLVEFEFSVVHHSDNGRILVGTDLY